MSTILIVDDNEDIRSVLEKLLERAGYKTVVASNGTEAVALAASSDPSLILMDVNMPELDGFSATTIIRQNSKQHRIPIIALTAYSLADDKARATAAGCDDFHPKPFEFERLLEQIKKLIEN